ncbi:MAG: zinc ribbon domain-containing protein [Armatimonadota bacterium]|nr:zinc ribbon domain-containing protein [Armatimonadota bacterium]
MPVFDYRCLDCRKRFSLLVGVVAKGPQLRCPNCGSVKIKKLISRFSALRSEDDIIDDLADPSKIGDLDNPKELRSWVKRMSREWGEDFGDEIDEAFEEAESGSDMELD